MNKLSTALFLMIVLCGCRESSGEAAFQKELRTSWLLFPKMAVADAYTKNDVLFQQALAIEVNGGFKKLRVDAVVGNLALRGNVLAALLGHTKEAAQFRRVALLRLEKAGIIPSDYSLKQKEALFCTLREDLLNAEGRHWVESERSKPKP